MYCDSAWKRLKEDRIHCYAMTLIEMLVVIAIIGLLAAFIVPSINIARERASRVPCMSNLRQVGVAVKTYLDDHDGVFPSISGQFMWGELAGIYAEHSDIDLSLFRCPSQDAELTDFSGPVQSQLTIPDSGGKWTTYEFNGYFKNPPGGGGMNAMSRGGRTKLTNPSISAYAYDFPFDPRNYSAELFAHDGGVNCLYLDWHVSWLPFDAMGLEEGTPFYELGHH